MKTGLCGFAICASIVLWLRSEEIAASNVITPWSTQTSRVNETLRSVAYGEGLFVAVGDRGTVLTSRGGRTWETQVTGAALTFSSVVYGSGQFIAVGEQEIWGTTNGMAWNQRTNYAAPLSQIHLTAASFGEDRFMAVGGTGISGLALWSNDGQNWHFVNPSSRGLLCVAYGDGQFVAAGGNYEGDNGSLTYFGAGTVVSSLNGTDWSDQPSGTVGLIRSIVYGNNAFIAVGNRMKPDFTDFVLTSTDAHTWTALDSGSWNSIAFGNGVFVAVGDQSIGISTKNGVFESATPTSASLHGIAYGDGMFVAVGDRGTILVAALLAPKLTKIIKLADATTQLTVEAPGSVAVEMSGDLKHWSVLNVFTNVATPVLTTDPATDLSTRFYRARLISD